MKELILEIDKKDILKLNESVEIKAILGEESNIEYKFMEGYNKVWTPIQGFSKENICKWIPKNSGKNMILVQGKIKDSDKPYDYKSWVEVEVDQEKKMILNVTLDNDKITVGEKVKINIEGRTEKNLYRILINEKDEWKVLKEYSGDKEYVFTATEAGKKDFLIECKNIDSINNVDEFFKISLEVLDLDHVEIIDFKCLNKHLVIGEDLEFSVDVKYNKSRTMLYKYLKIDKDGRRICVQDFSSNNKVSFKESEAGEHKVLCIVRDMFSDNDYDDRALITYNVKAYDKLKIRKINSDVISPQNIGTDINFISQIEGGKNVLYKYEVEGPAKIITGYTRNSEFKWKPTEVGNYTIKLKVKDSSFDGEYEDIEILKFKIDKNLEKPLRITEVNCNKGRKCVINEKLIIVVKCDGGKNILYKFKINKDNKLYETIDYKGDNWMEFAPKEAGGYSIEVMVKEAHSKKEYDANSSIYINCKAYNEIEIEHIIVNTKEDYIIGEPICLDVIAEDSKEALFKCVTKINGLEVENTGFIKKTMFSITPKCKGKYVFEIYGKNIMSDDIYDSKKDVIVHVKEYSPVRDTKIIGIEGKHNIGKTIEATAVSKGGKDVCYEFYLMKNNNWNLVQKYSRKNSYTFMPVDKGDYTLMVLSKSFYKKSTYEDYQCISFNVE